MSLRELLFDIGFQVDGADLMLKTDKAVDDLKADVVEAGQAADSLGRKMSEAGVTSSRSMKSLAAGASATGKAFSQIGTIGSDSMWKAGSAVEKFAAKLHSTGISGSTSMSAITQSTGFFIPKVEEAKTTLNGFSVGLDRIGKAAPQSFFELSSAISRNRAQMFSMGTAINSAVGQISQFTDAGAASLYKIVAETGRATVQMRQLGQTSASSTGLMSQFGKAGSDSMFRVGGSADITRDKIIRIGPAGVGAINSVGVVARSLPPEMEKVGAAGAKAMGDIGQSAKGAAGATKDVGSAFGAVGSILEKSRWASLGVFTGITAGVGVGVKAFSDFEAGMTRVGVITGATNRQFKGMSNLAIKLGADTKFSANEAAYGMELMAQSGFKTKEIMAASRGVLSAAAAGNIDVATSADVTTNVLRGFGLAANKASMVADVLAKTANSANVDGMARLGEGMKYVASIAAGLGISLNDTAATMAILGNAGIKGEQAGTTLRSAMLSLVKPTDDAATVMEGIGMKVTDAHGRLKPMSSIIDQLTKGTRGWSEADRAWAVSTIFGTEATTGMLALMKAGPSQINAFTRELAKSSGYADKVAKRNMNNLAGSLEQLSGSVDTAKMKFGSQFAPTIRWVADGLTSLTNKFMGLPDPIQKVIAFTTSGVGGFAGMAAGIGFLYPLVVNVNKAFTGLKAVGGVSAVLTKAGTGMRVFGTAFLPWGAGIAIVGGLTFAVWDLWKGLHGGKSILMPYVNTFLRWIGAGTDLKGVITGIGTVSRNVWTDVGPFLQGVGGGAVRAFHLLGSVVSFVSPLLTNYFGGALTVVKGSLQFTFGILTAFGGLLNGLATGDFKTFYSGLKMIGNGIKNIFGGLGQIAIAPLKWLKVEVENFVGWLVNKLNLAPVLQKALDWLPKPLKKLAEGALDLSYRHQMPKKAPSDNAVTRAVTPKLTTAPANIPRQNMYSTRLPSSAVAPKTILSIPSLAPKPISFADSILAGRKKNNQAMVKVTQDMRDHIPQSPAKKGPLSTIDKVGPGMWGTISKSILGASGIITGAMDKALAPVGDQVFNIPSPMINTPKTPFANIKDMVLPKLQTAALGMTIAASVVPQVAAMPRPGPIAVPVEPQMQSISRLSPIPTTINPILGSIPPLGTQRAMVQPEITELPRFGSISTPLIPNMAAMPSIGPTTFPVEPKIKAMPQLSPLPIASHLDIPSLGPLSTEVNPIIRSAPTFGMQTAIVVPKLGIMPKLGSVAASTEPQLQSGQAILPGAERPGTQALSWESLRPLESQGREKGSKRSVTNSRTSIRNRLNPNITINVNGAGDPQAVAVNVAAEVRRLLEQYEAEALASIVPEEVD